MTTRSALLLCAFEASNTFDTGDPGVDEVEGDGAIDRGRGVGPAGQGGEHDGGCFPQLRRPLHFQLLLVQGTVPQVEVDQVLVGHPEFRGQPLEVRHRRLVEPHRDRLFEHLDIRVPLAPQLAEIVMVSHGITSHPQFWYSAASFLWR